MNHEAHVDLLRRADLPAGGTWADLGAGSGAFTLALRELAGPAAVVYAVDKDRGSLGELERDWRLHFGTAEGLQLIMGDFTRPLDLPPLDGVVMANSLHFYRNPDRRRSKTSALRPPDKLDVLRRVRTLLKPDGALLLVEYDVDSGNIWVPYPLSFETFRLLAPEAGFGEPRRLAAAPSRFLRGFYSALAFPESGPGAHGRGGLA